MLPRDEKDLALLTIILGCEIKVKDSVSTFVIRDRTGKIIVSFFWIPKLFYLDLLSLLINFEHNEPELTMFSMEKWNSTPAFDDWENEGDREEWEGLGGF
ncbi:hypothetical protein CARUB_v10002331mg [Capsella rubella]|uniref:Uncharacterized protein n=1 Tax=Capsella rubella TaxID=81985 RepID=R0GRM4_9BRAS|nr:hypothetical protein CARUB_v10002331mg [Capsella rubella]